jgi:hypothetical protein
MREKTVEHVYEEMEKVRPVPVKDYGRPLKPIESANFRFFISIFVTIGSWIMLLPAAWYINELPGVISTPFNLAAWAYFIISVFLGGPLLVLWAIRHDVFKSWDD